MEFSVILKNLRLREDLTQKELAEELKLPQSTISKYEKGQLEANYKNLIKIADFFEVTIDYLLGRGKLVFLFYLFKALTNGRKRV